MLKLKKYREIAWISWVFWSIIPIFLLLIFIGYPNSLFSYLFIANLFLIVLSLYLLLLFLDAQKEILEFRIYFYLI